MKIGDSEKENVSVSLEKKSYKKFGIGIIVAICFFVGVYIVGDMYYKDKFYIGSSINSISVSGKTVEEADEILNERVKEYSLSLQGRDGSKGEIKSVDIGLKLDGETEVKALLEKEKSLSWIEAVFRDSSEEETKLLVFDKDLLKSAVDKSINSLNTLNGEKVMEPKNPTFKYEENKYKVVDEIQGNKIDNEKLLKEVEKAVLNGEEVLNLEESTCYVAPQYTKSSEKTRETLDTLNEYVVSSINYRNGKEILNGETINTFLEVNENLDVVINEKSVKSYVDKLANIFNTTGKKIDFKTSTGKNIVVGGGNYGNVIDKNKEVAEIIEAIKSGKSISKEPKYAQTTFAEEGIGNTYVEINFSTQQIWFYKNGALITNGSIVTGNISGGHGTPTGVYRLAYKQKDTVLRGDDYAAPVSFWMPFNGGIGMHDANWRSEFGGSIYKTNGSHGCINCPYEVAQAIYNNIEDGTPIVCFYE